MNNKYILGTAQLGMPYGIANNLGQPSLDIAKEIIACALDEELYYFDTAQMYGTSEEVLGKALVSFNAQNKAKIITKITYESLQSKLLLEKAIYNSLENLQVNSLYCFMLHHEEYLPYFASWQGDFLHKLRERGKFEKLGISIYTVEKALEALNHPLIDVLQIPTSLFDRRFIEANIFELAKELEKEIHVRSAFLQGVLCMSSESLPTYLSELKEFVEHFQRICNEHRCFPSQAALFWLKTILPNSFIIFGAESYLQIKQNMDTSWQQTINLQNFYELINNINVPQEEKLINPFLWGK